jgi:uncharacterized repeat protein (TIGR03803 family)
MKNRKLQWRSTGYPRAIVLAAVTSVLVLAVVQSARAQTYTILHSFGVLESDGTLPEAGLIRDSAGSLYGTTAGGGTRGDGIVFKLGKTGNETIMHNFGGGRGDGDAPYAGVIRDAAGNLYGTTSGGGAAFFGTVFQLDKHGTETILHSFTHGPRDGAQPCAGLVRDAKGNLYGTTPFGGNASCRRGGCGVVFKVSPSGKTVMLHVFAGNPDGAIPMAGLTRDRAGNLYGTTLEGGDGAGIVFKLDPKGFETVLYRFTLLANGESPSGGLVRDTAGNLYGVTGAGGDPNCHCGVIYKLDKSGVEAVLYSFKGGSDGALPVGNLVRDSAGNFYGVTQNGGNPTGQGVGTVFKLDLNGVETVLHSFAGFPHDGALPFAGLARDSAGTLYGTTWEGGTNDSGTVFKLTP